METWVQQIAYKTFKCKQTNLLCALSLWKPYKVLYTITILYFMFILLSSLIQNYFLFILILSSEY